MEKEQKYLTFKDVLEHKYNCYLNYILDNNYMKSLEEDVDCELYEELAHQNYEEIENSTLEDVFLKNCYFSIDLTEKQKKQITKFKNVLVRDFDFSEMKELQQELGDKTADMEYSEIYQYFRIDKSTYEVVKDYGGVVGYNKELNSYFGGVNHYGMNWGLIYKNTLPVRNKEKYLKK